MAGLSCYYFIGHFFRFCKKPVIFSQISESILRNWWHSLKTTFCYYVSSFGADHGVEDDIDDGVVEDRLLGEHQGKHCVDCRHVLEN